jgi:hypothetical protein
MVKLESSKTRDEPRRADGSGEARVCLYTAETFLLITTRRKKRGSDRRQQDISAVLSAGGGNCNPVGGGVAGGVPNSSS